MAKIVDTYEATICETFITAIEYGETDTLNTVEETQLDEWLDEVKAIAPSANMVFEYGEDRFFATDEITGLGATCVEVTVNFLK